jgi:pimeloyl-ACP methyl ester carboxylesterase
MEDPQALIRALDEKAEHLQSACGAGRMAWRRWGRGPELLLLHGGSGSWLHWLPSIPALAEHFTVWVPDMPGFGESDMPPEPVSFDAYCDIIRDGFLALRGGAQPIDMAGFSLGSSVAVRLARTLPVRNLVLSGANFQVLTQRPRRDLVSLRRITDPDERARGLLHNLRTMMIAHAEHVDAAALHLYDVDVHRRRLPRPALNNWGVITGELPSLAVQGRIFALSGADDQVIGGGPDVQRQALAKLRPDARYEAVPGAGHWVMYEGGKAYSDALLRLLA